MSEAHEPNRPKPACLTAIVPAAGEGIRMGKDIRKQFMLLDSLPVIIHTLRVLADTSLIDHIILIAPEGEEDFCRKEIEKHGIPRVYKVLSGGKNRQESVYAGLCELPPGTQTILVHDGVRPFVRKSDIVRVIDVVIDKVDAAILGIPLTDTPKFCGKSCGKNRFITSSPQRNNIWSAQTPQVFRVETIRKAHDIARMDNVEATDDSVLVERMGTPVLMVEGSADNIKITGKFDMVVGEAILKHRSSSQA